jgi:uncharacterized protein with GYD domain
MATYIVLANFTQQGLQAAKEMTTRRAAVKELAESLGGDFKHVYLTIGRYDVAVIVEMPNEETLAQLILGIGMQGNVRTETMMAFDESAVDRIMVTL